MSVGSVILSGEGEENGMKCIFGDGSEVAKGRLECRRLFRPLLWR